MINYKGQPIELDQKTGEFSWSDFKSTALLDVKKKIDAVQKQSLKVNAILFDGYDGFNGRYKEITITSRADLRNVWIKNNKGDRSKCSLHDLYADTEKNRQAMKEIKQLREQRSELDNKIYALEKSLVQLSLDDPV